MSTMNKQKLVLDVARATGQPKDTVLRIVDALFDQIVTVVVEGNAVFISGFGKFSRLTRKARIGFDPARQVEITIPATYAPKFAPSLAFRVAVKTHESSKTRGAKKGGSSLSD